MVENLKELNRICQKPRYKEVGNWMVRHILRNAALPITWALLHTNITANQVTIGSLLIGLSGISLLALPYKVFFLTGVALLQIWYLFDHVDGQIARYRGTASLTGRFFDFLTHHIIHGVIFFSLGFYSYRETHLLFYVVWGFLTSISVILFNLIHDTKYKTFFERLITMKTLQIISKEESSWGLPVEKQFGRRIFSLLHKLCEIHILMNILTAAALVEGILKFPLDLRFLLFFFYGVIVPFVTVTKIGYMIATKKIDREFQDTFHEIGRLVTDESTPKDSGI